MENELNIEESYNLILSNVHKRYNNLIEDGYSIKIKNEQIKYKNPYNNYSKEEKKRIREILLEEAKEDPLYNLPLYYLSDKNDKISMEDKYNLYMMETHYKDSIKEPYYENSYLMKKDDKFYLMKITSDDSLDGELSKTTKEEELELFYNYDKIELQKEEFSKYFNDYINNISLKYFENIGISYSRQTRSISLIKDTANNINKAILLYLYNKQKPILIQMNKRLYPKFSEKRFKSEFISGNIDLDSQYIDLKLLNNLKMIIPTMFSNEIENKSLDDIKDTIILASKDFDKFLINNKDEVSEIILTLLNHEINSNVNHLDFNEKNIKKEDVSSLKKRNNKLQLFINSAKNSIDIEPWNLVKGFIYEKILNKVEMIKNIENSNTKFPNNISKVFNDKIYHIDLENNDITWEYVNEEKDNEYYIEQKELFNERKAALIHDNPEISKEELKKELNPLLSRSIEPSNFLNQINYSDKDFKESNYFLLNSIIIENKKLFIEETKISLSNLIKYKKEELPDEEILKYKGINNMRILISLFEKYELKKECNNEFHKINTLLNKRLSNIDIIENIMEYINSDKIDIFKKVFLDYFEILEKNMINDLLISESIIDSHILKNEFYINKVFYIMKSSIELQDNNRDELDKTSSKDEVSLKIDDLRVDDSGIDDFFTNLDEDFDFTISKEELDINI